MAQAITTRYLGPSAGGRGSRVLAVAYGGRATVPYDHALDADGNHAAAAAALCRKLGWDPWEPRAHGVLASGDHVFVGGSMIAPAGLAREPAPEWGGPTEAERGARHHRRKAGR